ncbi:MAG: hypothetical protein HC846_02000 [Blastocatellia bacterium]|nr:hypothetical protein [Blastocatellia bacterium]
MAKIETITLDGRESSALNISGVVGFPRPSDNFFNDWSDVLVIQGFFNYIANHLRPDTIGLGGDYKVPKFTGVMDADTSSAIGAFQLSCASFLMMKTYDNRIDPANYKNRHLRSGRRQMSIVFLHILAGDAGQMAGVGRDGYIRDMMSLNDDWDG